MSWDVSSLYGLTGDAFELERMRIIDGYLQTLSAERRKEALSLQLTLDLARLKMSESEFELHLAKLIAENLENLSDQLVALRNVIAGPPKLNGS